MKGIKKLLTGILAATLAFSMNVTALAAGGTITVEKTENGTTYNFYRIFDIAGQDTLSPKDGNYDVVSYSINSDWAAFFTGEGAGAKYIVATNSGSLSPINVDGATKYINLTDDNIVEFTNLATKYAIETDKTKEATILGDGKNIDVTVAADGYYIMVPEDASIQNENSHGSIASITSTTPNATIQVKAKKPEIFKTDSTEDAEIGQIVNYEVTGVVPNTAGYTEYTYKITDTMTSGLTFMDDIVVKIGDTVITNDCKIDFTESSNSFTVDIPVIKYQANVGAAISVAYTCKVNEDAVIHTQEINDVKLTYGHTPTDTTDKKEELYSSKIIINKEDDKKTKLAGAKFALMNSEGEFYFFNDTDKKVEWVNVPEATIAGEKTVVTDAIANALANANTAKKITTKTTDDTGKAEFIGLKNGEYFLVEFEAPAGYNRLSNPQKAPVQGNNVDTKELENKAQAGQTEFDSRQTDEASTATVINKSGVKLPETGGIGTTIFYILGGVLIIAGVAYFMVRRKVNAE